MLSHQMMINDDSKFVNGAPFVHLNKQYISFIFGRSNNGSIKAVINKIPSFIGSDANVKNEKVD